MKHQEVALQRMRDREYYGLFMEQGTGKTWCLLADAERLYARGLITALLVISPNNVHINWSRREIPKHLEVPHVAEPWRGGGSKRQKAALAKLTTAKNKLRVFTINIEALLSKGGYEFAEQFAKANKTMIIVDESSRIKNPNAACTQRAMKLRALCKYARITTGTPATNAPVDVFSQMEFLKPGLLGTTNYRAFVATYAQVLGANHPMLKAMTKKNPRMAYAQIIAKDANGRPIWRDLDKLQRLLAPHSFRVLKEDCLDLPPKVFKQHYFTMLAGQMEDYKLMEQECRMHIGGEVIPVQALAAATKLQQITSGFVMHEDEIHYIVDGNPRLEALTDLVQDIQGQFIVWARFREEIRGIAIALQKAGISAASYYGETSREDRDKIIDDFQAGRIQAFIGNAQSAGVGLTLTAAQTAIFYSNDYSLEHRLQSEDRCHRKGTKGTVVYIDLVAEGSIDEVIAAALCSKSDMAAAIVGDLKKTYER